MISWPLLWFPPINLWSMPRRIDMHDGYNVRYNRFNTLEIYTERGGMTWERAVNLLREFNATN